jgi:hypothetical protein
MNPRSLAFGFLLVGCLWGATLVIAAIAATLVLR